MAELPVYVADPRTEFESAVVSELRLGGAYDAGDGRRWYVLIINRQPYALELEAVLALVTGLNELLTHERKSHRHH